MTQEFKEWTPKCCSDMKLAINDYHTIIVKHAVARMAGAVINYCPFCGRML